VQVDNSFLSALPDDIAQELKRDFKRQQNMMRILSTSPSKAERPGSSPAKKSKPPAIQSTPSYTRADCPLDSQRLVGPAEDMTEVVTLQEPSLCGETNTADVKTLLKEWINSSEVPGAEDVVILSTYLRELVTYSHLERLDLLVKYLYRYLLVIYTPGLFVFFFGWTKWCTVRNCQIFVTHLFCFVQRTKAKESVYFFFRQMKFN